MLSYQHGYHAGNFADVIKHLGLTRLAHYLTQKDKPLFYLETHSGKGLYDLKSAQSEKTNEYKEGIQLLWSQQKKLPAVFNKYIRIIRELNKDNLRFYPGSPYLSAQLLRNIDRAYFCELHPAEYDALKTLSLGHKKIHFSNSDGMAALNSLLPPPEKRGLIFIDPSYEIKDEYKTIPRAIKQAFTKFNTGTYCLWYPVVHRRTTDQLLRRLQEIGAKNALKVEFNLKNDSHHGMTGCGLWLINPPYTFAEEMKQIAEHLMHYFNPKESSFSIEHYVK